MNWWNDTVKFHGDISEEFDADIRPCFEGAAVDGKLTPEAFVGQWDKVKEWRIKFNHDIHPLPVAVVSGFMAQVGMESPMDVQNAMRLAWVLCTDG